MTLRDEFEHDGIVYQLIEQSAVFGAPAIIRSVTRDEHSGNEVAGIRDFGSLPLARVEWAKLGSRLNRRFDVFELLTALQRGEWKWALYGFNRGIRFAGYASRKPVYCECPLFAVVLGTTELPDIANDVAGYGSRLGLPEESAFVIARAADGRNYYHNARETLLAACGLPSEVPHV